jgi:hypothetical protein
MGFSVLGRFGVLPMRMPSDRAPGRLPLGRQIRSLGFRSAFIVQRIGVRGQGPKFRVWNPRFRIS